MKTHLCTFALAAGLGAYAPHSLSHTIEDAPPPSNPPQFPVWTIDWLRLNQQDPTGSFGVHIGPHIERKSSKDNSITFDANAGVSLTFVEKKNVITAELSPTLQFGVHAIHRFNNIQASFGATTSCTKVDPIFYSTDKICGLTADIGAGFAITKEIGIFSSLHTPLSGNLPRRITMGVTAQPFVDDPIWKGLSLSAQYNTTTSTYGHKTQDMSTTTLTAGYNWQLAKESSIFTGLAWANTTLKNQNTNIKVGTVIPATVFNLKF